MARPRKLDLDDLRLQIIAAAREILSEADISALTARGLAERIGLPASAIYRIFPTMAEVVMAVNEATFHEIDALFEALPPEAPPLERFQRLAAGYIGYMRQNPSLWRALFVDARRQEDYPEWYLKAIAGLMGRLSALLGAVCPEVPPQIVAEATGKLFVFAHGAISLELDGRLGLITPLSTQEIAFTAIESTLAQLKAYGKAQMQPAAMAD